MNVWKSEEQVAIIVCLTLEAMRIKFSQKKLDFINNVKRQINYSPSNSAEVRKELERSKYMRNFVFNSLNKIIYSMEDEKIKLYRNWLKGVSYADFSDNVIKMINEVHSIGFQNLDMNEYDRGNVVLLNNNIPLFCINAQRTFHPRLIQIGRELNRIGGLDLMQEVYYAMIEPFGENGTLLNYIWNGIGLWKA